jgi:hypothetical protein
MNWTLIAAVLGTGLLAALTDWLFMGMLFHDAYNRYPEVWWPGIREGKETGPIIWSSAIGLVITAAIFILCAWANVQGIGEGLGVALAAWVAGPLGVIVINGFFIKIDPKVTFAHCLGYLARFALAGAAAGYVLPLH